MRKSDAMGLARPKLSSGDVLSSKMSFPNSIRLEPIRLPRPTILREQAPVFDISSQQQDLMSYPCERFRVPYAATYSPHSFPDYLRIRQTDPADPVDLYDRQLTRSVSPRNLTYLGPEVTPVQKIRPPVQEDLYFGGQPIRESPSIPRVASSGQQIQYPQSAVAGTVPTVTDIVQSSHQSSDAQTVRARALARNPFLGYQRIIFIMARYPALVLAMVALWNVTGRGQGMPKSSTEEIAFYAALTTAGIILASQILLHSNHHGSLKKARAMCYLYHFVMIVAFCTALVCIVFAVININTFRSKTPVSTTCKYMNYSPCYSNQERLTYLATLIGCSGAIVLLAFATFLYGAIGIGMMKKRLTEEYRRDANRRTYENQAFQY
uniref:MARVEL domain-containing protein n=1 Tax=Haemonchus contortus TaxID=6289 RepID=A0A7I5EBD6_HAECO